MKYRLLSNGTGVILDRTPTPVTDELEIEFEGFDYGSVAIVSGKRDVYKTLTDGICRIPAGNLSESNGVCVVFYDNTPEPRRTICEGFICKSVEGVKFIYPDDSSLSDTVASLRTEAESLKESFNLLEGKFYELEDKFITMMEGYDLV